MKYNIYHETLHSVFNEVAKGISDKGIVSEEFSNFLCTGGIGYNENRRFNFEIDSIRGKNTRKGLQIQVARFESGTYELNCYTL